MNYNRRENEAINSLFEMDQEHSFSQPKEEINLKVYQNPLKHSFSQKKLDTTFKKL